MNVVPWSYSSLKAFEQCPRRFKLTRITKQVKEPPTEHTTHGQEIHKSLERAINGEQALPSKHAEYQPIVDLTRNRKGKKLVEWKFALTKGFRPTEFFAKDTWVRGVIDYGVVTERVAVLVDWKTGKPKSDYDQMSLFAGVAFAAFPYIEQAHTGYVWLGHNRLEPRTFRREDASGIWQEFLPRIQRMEAAQKNDDFPPRPSGLCRGWCPVPKSMCEFSEPK